MSPVVGSGAGATSHGFGDRRFTKQVTDVSAQRLEGRVTSFNANHGYAITLNQTPTAGDILVIATSTNGVLVTQNPPTYGTGAGSVAAVASSGQINGTLQMKVWYFVLTSANIASGGTTIQVTNSANPTAAAYSVAELVGVNTANPIDSTSNVIGTTSGGQSFFIQFLDTTTPLHRYQGAAGLAFGTLAGARTLTGAVVTTLTNSAATLSSTWGSFTAASDIAALLINYPGAVATDFSNAAGCYFTSTGATARAYVHCYVDFIPTA